LKKDNLDEEVMRNFSTSFKFVMNSFGDMEDDMGVPKFVRN
jgi:hypothetical protein